MRSHAICRQSKLLRLVVYICTFCIFVPVSVDAIETGGTILTNMEILERVSGDAINEIISNMPPLDGEKTIFIRKDRGIGESDFVFENMIIKLFDDAGYRVTLEKPDVDSLIMGGETYRLSYQIIMMSLEYPKISRRYWFGSKEVERTAEIDVFARLTDLGSGGIVWVGEAQKKFDDVIRYSALDDVEDDDYEFTRPPRKEFRLSRLVEPVVVTGIVVGLVYLFFSNQSNE